MKIYFAAISLLLVSPLIAQNEIPGPELLSRVAEAIKASAYAPVNDEDLYKNAIDGMVRRLFSSRERRVVFPKGSGPMTESRSGLGIRMAFFPKSGVERAVVIEDVFPNGAGFSAGLQQGDKIIEIDGNAIAAVAEMEKIADMISGKPGTKVCLQIQRASSKKNLCATRKPILAPRFKTQIISDLGIIEVLRLEKMHAGKDFAAALAQLEKKKISNFIIDFRFNEAAELEAGIQFMEQLLPNGIELFAVAKKTEKTTFATKNSRLKSKRAGNYIVVQGIQAGGMVESLTRLLQKHFSAKVIGQPSVGHAQLSELVPVDDKFSILVPTGEITDVDGTRWHEQPVSPDVLVDNIDEAILSREMFDALLPAKQVL